MVFGTAFATLATWEETIMRDFQSILFATDFRSPTDNALEAAAQLATALNAKVSVLHVLEPMSTGAAVHFFHHQISEQLMQGTVQTLTEKGVQLEGSHLKPGAVADTILHAAEEADLTILGAGQRNERGEFVLGPHVESIVSHTSRPALVVRPGEPHLKFQRILCAVDHSESSAHALQYAIRLAQLFHGELTVLSVVPELSWLMSAVDSGGLVDVKTDHVNQWRSSFDEFLSQVDFGEVSWQKELASGVTHDVILATAAERQADLLVMGTTGRSRVARILLGSTTRRILRRLPCSLLTVKQPQSS